MEYLEKREQDIAKDALEWNSTGSRRAFGGLETHRGRLSS